MLDNDHAETVGTGVAGHKQYVVPLKEPVDGAEEDPAVVSLDGPAEWSDVPTFPDQMRRDERYWKLDRVEVKVFNLSSPDDVIALGELLTDVVVPGSNRTVTVQEKQWCEAIGNWKVYVEIQYVKFRKIVKEKSA